MRASVLAVALIVCPDICLGQQAVAPTNLPVRRVVLYKTGVGYFEHQGEVRGNQDVTIRFTSRQLNDVLKSLTTIDPRGRVSNINYNSMAPIEQRLGALRLPLDTGGTAFDVLASLRGVRVEVTARGAAPVQGRILGVERKVNDNAEKPGEVRELSILGDSGQLRSFELSPALRVRVVDRDMRQEVGRYLDVIGSTRERDVRNMVISTAGSGTRPLFVSYVSEVPVWKSTYRLVIPPEGKPFLQGWAVVDNTIGEDWTSVELSLVAGSPQSFIQEISQPYYVRRPVVPLPNNMTTTPQTHAAGLSAEVLQSARVEGGITRDQVVRGSAGGVMGGVVGALPSAPAPPAPAQPYEQLRNIEPAAQPTDLGDLFQYRIKEPVTLRKDQSALVPIINSSIDVEKVSVWNRGAASGHPLRAVWLTNTTGLTLDGGTMTIVDGNAFAGEGLVESLATAAKRLVSYATDLGIIVTGRLQSGPGRISRIRAREGILIHETEERATWSYAIRNEEATPTTLIIEHRLRKGWKLAAGQSPIEVAGDAPRFPVTLAPNQETVLVVQETLAGELKVQLSEVNDSLIASFSQSGHPVQALLAALKPLLDKKAELSTLERELGRRGAEQTTIVADQQRLRENMKALRGSAEEKALLQRYTSTLNQQESKLEALRRTIEQLTTQSEAVRGELSRLISELTFDISG
jgi:hypothetical protein